MIYYQDNQVVIYHGDCLEILPSLSSVDAVITDPPYGIALKANYLKTRKASQERDTRRHAWMSRKHDDIHGDDRPFDPAPFLNFPIVLLWGANAYAEKLPSRYSWLVWDKKDGRGAKNSFSDCELCWCSGVPFNSVRIFRHMWTGYQRDSEVGQKSLHPTQKPVKLMQWCIEKAGMPKTILDPYMGSGPTLRAAKDLGLQAIGIEINERYCEIAAKRMEK